jgi:hypothetical protein
MLTRHLLGLVVALSSSSLATVALAEDTLVPVAADRVFVPTGFDDNDSVQVVVDGNLSNSCYKAAAGEFTIDTETHTILLTPMARVSDSAACLQVLVPYTYVYELGVLPRGDYSISVAGMDGSKRLSVAEATSAGPDDEFYAAIDNAYVAEFPSLGRRAVMLEGTYTNTCMRWVRADLKHVAPDVIEVLPVVAIVDNGNCVDMKFPFKGVSVDLPTLERGRYLLHVRAMNGSAVNRVFEISVP